LARLARLESLTPSFLPSFLHSLKDGIPINDDALRRLKEAALSLILPFFDARENPRRKAFRLIGLRVEKLF